MANPTAGEAKAAFLKTFRATAKHKHRYDVFRDFVTMAACSLHNAVWNDVDREQEYLEIIGSYDRDDQMRFPELLAHLVAILEPEPRDVLGPLYMELEIANKDAGQFFTPPELSDVMSHITLGDLEAVIQERGFIMLSEPACGAGGMVLSVVKTLTQKSCDPAKTVWAQCIDIDRLAALMCYVQLTLWHVPAEVIVGDTLRWEHREVWYTPSHYLGGWSRKLKERVAADTPSEDKSPQDYDDIQESGAAAGEDARSVERTYDTYTLTWKGQELTVAWCPDWTCSGDGQPMGHLEITTEDRSPHPISDTGYRSHFVKREDVEQSGGPVRYVQDWLAEKDDGKAVQLSLF